MRFTSILSCSLLAAAILDVGAVHHASAADLPQPPDFSRRVNYVDWYRGVAKVPAKENAYSLYAEFMPGLVGSDVDEAKWPEFAGMLTSPFTDEEQSRVSEEDRPRVRKPLPWYPDRRGTWEQSFQRTSGVLKKFAVATKRKHVVAPPNIDGERDDNANRLERMTLPHVQKIRQCAQGTLENAWRIEKNGDVPADRFITAIETNLRAAGQLRTSKFAIELLAGYAIRRQAYDHLRWAFAHGVLDESDAAAVGKMLRSVDGTPLDASHGLGTECAIMLDNLQYIFGPLGGGGVTFNGNRYREVTGQTMGGGNRFGLGARIETDPQGTAAAVVAAFSEMSRHMKPGFSAERHQAMIDIARALQQKNNLTKGLYMGIETTYATIYRQAALAEADRRATQVLVELFAYKAAKGKWPAKLAELDKKLVGKVLKDPFSNRPFVYHVIDKSPVIYSVSIDGQDDGGSHDTSGNEGADFVYWPIPDSDEWLTASRLNRVPAKKLTPLSKIDEKLKSKRVTISAIVSSVSSRPSKKHRERHSIILKDGDVEVKMYYYADVASRMTERQKLVEGRKIRAVVKVVHEDGRWVLELRDARDLAHEQ